jgi:hypothetical protein
MKVFLGSRLDTLQRLVVHISRIVNPAAFHLRLGKRFAKGRAEPQGSFASLVGMASTRA